MTPALLMLLALPARAGDLSLAGSAQPGGVELVDPVVSAAGSIWLGTAVTDVDFLDAGQRRLSAVRFSAGAAPTTRLRFDTELPMYTAVISGDAGASQAAVGDLRVGATYGVAAERGPSIGGFAWVSAPTGPLSTQLGGAVGVAAGQQTDRYGWRLNVGPARLGGVTGAWVGGGGEVAVAPWARLGGEATLAPGGLRLSGTARFGAPSSTLGAWVLAGTAVGESRYRAGGGLTWRWSRGRDDFDGDGLVDRDDGCPFAAEDFDGFDDLDGCPDPDNDLDGLTDAVDVCPLEAEDLDTYRDDDGCPDIDNDSDGVLDDDDDCPLVAGRVRGCPDTDSDGFADIDDLCPLQPGPVEGCLDTDGDRVPDPRDRCPLQPAPPGADPRRSDGCPTSAFFDRSGIVIRDKIYFDTDSARIRPTSYPLLREVAARLRENPDIPLLEIAGFTDNTGPAEYNQRLSEQRAASVRRFLVEEGAIAPERLQVAGYGETRPLTSNDTEEGRAVNRRVEFSIVPFSR